MYLQQCNNGSWSSSSNMWKYSNPTLTLSDPKEIEFQTPVSGTINLTLTNNTGSAISNTYYSPLTPNPRIYQYFITSSGTTKLYSNTSYPNRHTFWYANTTGSDVVYRIKNLTTQSIQCAQFTTGNSPSSNGTSVSNKVSISPGNVGTITIPTGKSVVIGYATATNGFSEDMFELTLNTTSYNLAIADSSDNDVYVDLGQSTLAVNETITVPITFTSSTNRFYFYYKGSLGNWPEVSFSYTGWSIKNASDSPIHERSNGSWT